ncbi:MAG: tRNA preQ1(34) S-adenosylmethionine ribosyltransferase-isomerase QueA [Acidimicrobiia bacterium]
MLTSEFDYSLPADRIAQLPIEPRDSARLLDTRDLTDHRFRNLPQLLEPGDLVVVNRTRVRAARLTGRKLMSGGAVEALLLGPLTGTLWRAILKPARRLRPGEEIAFGAISATIVKGPVDGVAVLDLWSADDVETAITAAGQVPLPPYIKTELADSERYQTIFAKEVGSAAAPTAALHFTEEVVENLGKRGIGIAEIELQIGLDTFRPISSPTVEKHQIHSEQFFVPGTTRSKIDACRGRVVAVGTTVVRALESETDTGSTDLFITPGFRFRVVDLLVTNFHLPRTTLLVLLAAFMGDGWRNAYEVALERRYRFASFGDAMLAELQADHA